MAKRQKPFVYPATAAAALGNAGKTKPIVRKRYLKRYGYYEEWFNMRPCRDAFRRALSQKLAQINPQMLDEGIIRNTFTTIRTHSEKLQTVAIQERTLKVLERLNEKRKALSTSFGIYEDVDYKKNKKLLENISKKLMSSPNPSAINWKSFFEQE